MLPEEKMKALTEALGHATVSSESEKDPMEKLIQAGRSANQRAIVEQMRTLERATREEIESIKCECHRCGFEFEGAAVRGRILDHIKCPQCGEGEQSQKALPPLRQTQMMECNHCGTEYLLYNDHFGCPSCGVVNLPDNNQKRVLSWFKKETFEK